MIIDNTTNYSVIYGLAEGEEDIVAAARGAEEDIHDIKQINPQEMEAGLDNSAAVKNSISKAPAKQIPVIKLAPAGDPVVNEAKVVSLNKQIPEASAQPTNKITLSSEKMSDYAADDKNAPRAPKISDYAADDKNAPRAPKIIKQQMPQAANPVGDLDVGEEPVAAAQPHALSAPSNLGSKAPAAPLDDLEDVGDEPAAAAKPHASSVPGNFSGKAPAVASPKLASK